MHYLAANIIWDESGAHGFRHSNRFLSYDDLCVQLPVCVFTFLRMLILQPFVYAYRTFPICRTQMLFVVSSIGLQGLIHVVPDDDPGLYSVLEPVFMPL